MIILARPAEEEQLKLYVRRGGMGFLPIVMAAASIATQFIGKDKGPDDVGKELARIERQRMINDRKIAKLNLEEQTKIARGQLAIDQAAASADAARRTSNVALMVLGGAAVLGIASIFVLKGVKK